MVVADVFGSDVVGQAGVIVPRDDAPALARAIDALLDDELRRRQLGEAARRRSASYDLDTTLDRTLELWSALVGERRAARRRDPSKLGG
jgi:glycosyltransferase involved in cell wall biosynthesis